MGLLGPVIFGRSPDPSSLESKRYECPNRKLDQGVLGGLRILESCRRGARPRPLCVSCRARLCIDRAVLSRASFRLVRSTIGMAQREQHDKKHRTNTLCFLALSYQHPDRTGPNQRIAFAKLRKHSTQEWTDHDRRSTRKDWMEKVGENQ